MAESPLLLALSNPDCKPEDIQRLLNQGASITREDRNDNPPLLRVLLNPHFKVDVIKLLLDNGARIDLMDAIDKLQFKIKTYVQNMNEVLECSYKEDFMRLLLDYATEANFVAVKEFQLIHYTVINPMCWVDDLKKLISQGVDVNAKTRNGSIPLHHYLGTRYMREIDAKIVTFLIENGADINSLCLTSGFSCLGVAVMNKFCGPDVVKLLLDNGAIIHGKDKRETDLLDSAIFRFNLIIDEHILEKVNILIKYSVIEILDFDLEPYLDLGSLRKIKSHRELVRFARNCSLEVQKMDSEIIYDNVTLLDFVRGQASFKEDVDWDIKQVLHILNDNKYPLYREVILTKLKRPALLNKLSELSIYTVTRGPDQPNDEKIVALDYLSSSTLAEYLDYYDLLNFVSAFILQSGVLLSLVISSKFTHSMHIYVD